MGRRAGRRTYLPIGNGKHVYIPNISSPHHFQYRVLGIRVKTLKDIQRGIDGRLRIEYWSLYDGVCDGKFRLNYDTGNWDLIEK